jgi:hypothetical protein
MVVMSIYIYIYIKPNTTIYLINFFFNTTSELKTNLTIYFINLLNFFDGYKNKLKPNITIHFINLLIFIILINIKKGVKTQITN